MIAEAIDKILEHAKGQLLTDQNGLVYKTGDVDPVRCPEPMPEPLYLHTLDGLLDYLVGAIDTPPEESVPPSMDTLTVAEGTAFAIRGPAEVALVGDLFGDFQQRHTVAVASAFLPKRGFCYGEYMTTDRFVIGMQGHFVQDEATAEIISVIGNAVQDEEVVTEDDGMSQQVTARRGISGRQHVALPNPVTLRPYRTFPEIVQPESQFVVRLQTIEGHATAALFEAGDCRWKVKAVQAIAEYLRGRCEDLPVLA